jgi:ABC-type bacteriocin/lantibiotic exporter with double-glycine peptidase domain
VTWDGLYQIAGNMVLLGIYIGPSALAGLGTMLLLIPLNFMSMMRMGTLRRAISKENDSRIKVTNEVLQGIRAVKVYAWEASFTRKLNELRVVEMMHVLRSLTYKAVSNCVMMVNPNIMTFIAFTTLARRTWQRATL